MAAITYPRATKIGHARFAHAIAKRQREEKQARLCRRSSALLMAL
jgi:hypothetical protein